MAQRQREIAQAINDATHHAREAGIAFGYRMAAAKNDTHEMRLKEGFHSDRSGAAKLITVDRIAQAIRAATRGRRYHASP